MAPSEDAGFQACGTLTAVEESAGAKPDDERRTMTEPASSPETSDARRDALVERLFMAAVGTWDVFAVYIGDRLGLYRTLAERGPSTSAELAQAAGLNERYVREWLEQQASSAILELEEAGTDAAARRYSLPPGHDEALVDDASLNCIAPLGQLVVACGRPIDAVLDAFRTGDGVAYADYGTDLHEGQARFTRPMFDQLLTREWLPAVAGVHERLLADPPARVADIACGEGRSSMALARGYPNVRVDGIDMDKASIEAARRHLAGSGLEERVEFHLRDAADEELAGNYDLVYIHEALHDMSHPVDVLAACRGLLANGGSLIVGDERVPDTFDPPGDEIERFYYGCSILHCLPVGMVGENAAGTGTVMRADTVGGYAKQAGFSRFHILPIENDFYRFYLMS